MVLAHPHFGRDFLLETDASGMGAVLSQEQEDRSIRPIAFTSRMLQSHEGELRYIRAGSLRSGVGHQTFSALFVWPPLNCVYRPRGIEGIPEYATAFG